MTWDFVEGPFVKSSVCDYNMSFE